MAQTMSDEIGSSATETPGLSKITALMMRRKMVTTMAVTTWMTKRTIRELVIASVNSLGF